MKANREHRVPPRRRGPRRSADAQRRRPSTRVHHRRRRAARRDGASPAAGAAAGRGRATRLPFVVPGLGGGGDGAPSRVIEAALAHVVENKVEAAYARSDLFERRRLLMDEWAAYLAGRVRQTDDDAGPCAPGRFGTIRCQSLNPATPREESRRLPTSGWPCLSTGHRTLINPGITRGALSVWLLLPGSAISPARTAVSDATALRPP